MKDYCWKPPTGKDLHLFWQSTQHMKMAHPHKHVGYYETLLLCIPEVSVSFHSTEEEQYLLIKTKKFKIRLLTTVLLLPLNHSEKSKLWQSKEMASSIPRGLTFIGHSKKLLLNFFFLIQLSHHRYWWWKCSGNNMLSISHGEKSGHWGNHCNQL